MLGRHNELLDPQWFSTDAWGRTEGACPLASWSKGAGETHPGFALGPLDPVPDLHYPSPPKTNPANFGEFLYRLIVRNVKTETDIKKRMEVTYSLTILRQPY